MRSTIGIAVILFFFLSCGDSAVADRSNHPRYVDLPGFFEDEISRLKANNSMVAKKVSVGEEVEADTVTISDWSRELASFVAIDINKPAYQGHIAVDSSNMTVSYKLDNPDLDIQRVDVVYDETGIPSEITIERKIKNFLYTTTEKLFYHRDQGYKIIKHQDVWMLGANDYYIEGKF